MFKWYWLDFLISVLVSDFKIFHEQTSPGLEDSMTYAISGVILESLGEVQCHIDFYHKEIERFCNFDQCVI